MKVCWSNRSREKHKHLPAQPCIYRARGGAVGVSCPQMLGCIPVHPATAERGIASEAFPGRFSSLCSRLLPAFASCLD